MWQTKDVKFCFSILLFIIIVRISEYNVCTSYNTVSKIRIFGCAHVRFEIYSFVFFFDCMWFFIFTFYFRSVVN